MTNLQDMSFTYRKAKVDTHECVGKQAACLGKR